MDAAINAVIQILTLEKSIYYIYNVCESWS